MPTTARILAGLMIYQTPESIPTHVPPWSEMLAPAIAQCAMYLCGEFCEDDWESGISAFDRLTLGQRTWLLNAVGQAMLIESAPPPDLYQAVDATAGAIFQMVAEQIEEEIHFNEPCYERRRAVLACCIECGLDPEEDELPTADTDDASVWAEIVDCVAESVLYDRDYGEEDLFLDEAPAVSRLVKSTLGILDDYFSWIPPDPEGEELAAIVKQLAKLTNQRLP